MFDQSVINAATEYIKRQNRTSHPDGDFDNGGRWYPSDRETCSCCRKVRSPSRAWPYSYMTHCRTAGHVANLYGVSARDVKRAAKQLQVEAA